MTQTSLPESWVRISGPIEALTQALMLSATAPDEVRSRMALNLAGQIAATMTPAQIRSAKEEAQIRICGTTCETFWLLTVSYGYDDYAAEHMMEGQSLHRSKDAAMLRVFDIIYEVAGATPHDTTVSSHVTRDDGAEFADVDTTKLDDVISYSIVPLAIDDERGAE